MRITIHIRDTEPFSIGTTSSTLTHDLEILRDWLYEHVHKYTVTIEPGTPDWPDLATYLASEGFTETPDQE